MTALSYFSKLIVISVECIKLPLFKMNQLVKNSAHISLKFL